MGGFIRGLMAKKIKVVTSPPAVSPPPIVTVVSYLLDMLGNVLTDNSGNRLIAG